MSIPLIPSDNDSGFPGIASIESSLKKVKWDAFDVISKLVMKINLQKADKVQITNVKNFLPGDDRGDDDNNLDHGLVQ